MRYTFDEAVKEVLNNVEPTTPPAPEIQSQQLHRWIGEAHMGASGRLRGPGHHIEYTEKDIRRAVAYLRLRALIGAGIGANAQAVRERIREVASWHTEGWVTLFVTGNAMVVDWDQQVSGAVANLATGNPVLVIPCSIQDLDDKL